MGVWTWRGYIGEGDFDKGPVIFGHDEDLVCESEGFERVVGDHECESILEEFACGKPYLVSGDGIKSGEGFV
jgi:hypothetical protein